MQKDREGKFVISLDFELFWGVRDVYEFIDYRDHIAGVWEVVPKTLDMFIEHGINATWATVGFLFANSYDEVSSMLPESLPTYTDKGLSPYVYNSQFFTENPQMVPYHFAPSLIERIATTKGQEIGSHTFSHYYCQAHGQSLESFRSDLKSAVDIAAQKKIGLKSLVFPRNQVNTGYLEVLADFGFNSYRGVQNSWIYSNDARFTLIQRLFRLLDSYVNITGDNSYPICSIGESNLKNIPGSSFLRPYNRNLHYLEKYRVRRILNSMTRAATKGEIYHLWWHPHNFGVDQRKNFEILETILQHYNDLNEKYGFVSANMKEIVSSYEQS